MRGTLALPGRGGSQKKYPEYGKYSIIFYD